MSKIVVTTFTAFLAFTGIEYMYYLDGTDEYTYHKLDAANQTDPHVLFEEEMPPEPEDSVEQLPELHIPAIYVGRSVNQEMLNYFRLRLEPIYQDGTRIEYVAPKIAEHALYDFADEWSVDNPYVREAITYRGYCRQNPNLANEYQYGRSLNDAGMILDDMGFAEKIALMSDSVSILEHFLNNKNRDVGTKENPKEIETWYVVLQIGKLFLHNALVAEVSEGAQEYVGCFLAEAYICFQIGVALVAEGTKYYALLNYYAGNAGENILIRIDSEVEPVLYQTIGWETLEYYETARQYCASHPNMNFNGIENFIPHVESGLRTLQSFGFSYSSNSAMLPPRL